MCYSINAENRYNIEPLSVQPLRLSSTNAVLLYRKLFQDAPSPSLEPPPREHLYNQQQT